MTNALNIIDTSNAKWYRGRKIKNIRAKLMTNIFADTSISKYFLINTLEGNQPIDISNVCCVGELGEAWQQSVADLLKKYDIVDNTDNWLICKPKPENEVEFFEIDEDEGYVQGIWGTTIGDHKNLQSFIRGDFVCRQLNNHAEQYVVRRALFLNTYVKLD